MNKTNKSPDIIVPTSQKRETNNMQINLKYVTKFQVMIGVIKVRIQSLKEIVIEFSTLDISALYQAFY